MNTPTPHTNDALITEYIQYLTSHRRDATTPRICLRILFRYLERRGIETLGLRSSDAQAFQTDCAMQTGEDGKCHYARGSVCAIVRIASAFYEYLMKRRYVSANPFRNIERLKQHRRLPRALVTEADMDRLLNRLKHFTAGMNLTEKKQLYKAHLIAELLYATGARIHEVTGLRVEDVDLARGIVRITDRKTGTMRDGILNSFTVALLRIYLTTTRAVLLNNGHSHNRALLFGTGTPSRLSSWMGTMLKRECAALGLPAMASHAIRHAVGYHLLRGGCDIRYIQELLGHRRLDTTQVYTRVDKEDLKRVLDEYHPRRSR